MSTPVAPRMRALRYHLEPARFLLAGLLGKRAPVGLAPLRLERVAIPDPPSGWRHVDVTLAGVCGSDLALLFGTASPRISAFSSFPMNLGHEILGEVDGTRVVVNPTTACRERGVEPCEACTRGDDNLCASGTEGALAAGFLIGYQRDLAGGWGEALVAHEARIHSVPDDVPDDRAALAEPFAVAWRAARTALERTGARHLLVVGSGSIGLVTIVALRRAGFVGELHVIARHANQAEAARAMGADHVHDGLASARARFGRPPVRAAIGPPAWRGGFDVVVDAAGSRSSLDAAAWAAREGGAVVLVGGPGIMRHDFTPHWFREVALLGSSSYREADFAEAVAQLPHVAELDRLEVRRYPLERYAEAIGDLRARRALKVAFEPRA